MSPHVYSSSNTNCSPCHTTKNISIHIFASFITIAISFRPLCLKAARDQCHPSPPTPSTSSRLLERRGEHQVSQCKNRKTRKDNDSHLHHHIVCFFLQIFSTIMINVLFLFCYFLVDLFFLLPLLSSRPKSFNALLSPINAYEM